MQSMESIRRFMFHRTMNFFFPFFYVWFFFSLLILHFLLRLSILFFFFLLLENIFQHLLLLLSLWLLYKHCKNLFSIKFCLRSIWRFSFRLFCTFYFLLTFHSTPQSFLMMCFVFETQKFRGRWNSQAWEMNLFGRGGGWLEISIMSQSYSLCRRWW